MTQKIKEIPRLRNHDVLLLFSTYKTTAKSSLDSSFRVCAFSARSRLLRLADQWWHVIPLTTARTWEESPNNLNLRCLQAVSRQISAIFIVKHCVINHVIKMSREFMENSIKKGNGYANYSGPYPGSNHGKYWMKCVGFFHSQFN